MSKFFLRSVTGDYPVLTIKSVPVKVVPETESLSGYMCRLQVEISSINDLKNFLDEVDCDLIVGKDLIQIYDGYIE